MKLSTPGPLHSRHFTESILKSMFEGLIILDQSNRVEAVNEAALKLFRLTSEEEFLGRHINTLYLNEDGADNFIARMNAHGNLRDQEDTFVQCDGRTFTGLYSASLIPNTENSTEVKVIFIQDITERNSTLKKLAEYTERLEKSNKELDQFAYIVSHDLKAPLRAISNLSTWLQEDLGPTLSDDVRSNLNLLRSRVSRLESLINGVLQYSKTGKEQVASETVETYLLLSEVLELLSPPPHFKIEIDPTLPTLEAPRTLLYQVFSNLVSNAIKYCDKEEGLIRVSVVDQNDHYEFSVEDNGPGIDPEYHEKIFIIFQTLQSRDKFESTGIGLTITRRIVEDRKGRIWVESEPGKGSKFIFTWPKENQINRT